NSRLAEARHADAEPRQAERVLPARHGFDEKRIELLVADRRQIGGEQRLALPGQLGVEPDDFSGDRGDSPAPLAVLTIQASGLLQNSGSGQVGTLARKGDGVRIDIAV